MRWGFSFGKKIMSHLLKLIWLAIFPPSHTHSSSRFPQSAVWQARITSYCRTIAPVRIGDLSTGYFARCCCISLKRAGSSSSVIAPWNDRVKRAVPWSIKRTSRSSAITFLLRSFSVFCVFSTPVLLPLLLPSVPSGFLTACPSTHSSWRANTPQDR